MSRFLAILPPPRLQCLVSSLPGDLGQQYDDPTTGLNHRSLQIGQIFTGQQKADRAILAWHTFVQPTNPVFKTGPTLRTLKGGWGRKRKDAKRPWLAGDLERAQIPVKDDHGRTIDRHSFRMTFISWLGCYGVDPRAQIVLARHAPQGVTLRNYQDFGVFDLWAEIASCLGRRAGAPVTRLSGQRGPMARLPLSVNRW